MSFISSVPMLYWLIWIDCNLIWFVVPTPYPNDLMIWNIFKLQGAHLVHRGTVKKELESISAILMHIINKSPLPSTNNNNNNNNNNTNNDTHGSTLNSVSVMSADYSLVSTREVGEFKLKGFKSLELVYEVLKI